MARSVLHPLSSVPPAHFLPGQQQAQFEESVTAAAAGSVNNSGIVQQAEAGHQHFYRGHGMTRAEGPQPITGESSSVISPVSIFSRCVCLCVSERVMG